MYYLTPPPGFARWGILPPLWRLTIDLSQSVVAFSRSYLNRCIDMKTCVTSTLYLSIEIGPMIVEPMTYSIGHLCYRWVKLFMDGELYGEKKVLICKSFCEEDILREFEIKQKYGIYLDGHMWDDLDYLLNDINEFDTTFTGQIKIDAVVTYK